MTSGTVGLMSGGAMLLRLVTQMTTAMRITTTTVTPAQIHGTGGRLWVRTVRSSSTPS